MSSNPCAGTPSAIVAAVRALVGTAFRPQGRTPGLALDCVGVALIAAQAARLQRIELPRYALGGDHDGRIEMILRALGCREVVDAAPGDVVLAAPAGRQRHLAIVTPGGAVHAHAGIGHVIEAPLDPDWDILSIWRFPGVG